LISEQLRVVVMGAVLYVWVVEEAAQMTCLGIRFRFGKRRPPPLPTVVWSVVARLSFWENRLSIWEKTVMQAIRLVVHYVER